MELTGVTTSSPAASHLTRSRERLDQMWDTLMHENFGGRRMPHQAIVDSLDGMSKQLGVNTPRLYVTDSFPVLYGGKAPNMAAVWTRQPELGHGIVMTKSYLELFKFDGTHVPAEIRATLGHELGHVKQGGRYLDAVRKYPMLLGPAVAMTGLYLYDRAQRRNAADMPKALAEEVRVAKAEADEQHCNSCKHLPPEGQAISSQFAENKKDTIDAGHYVIAGAAGLAGGGLLTRHLMLEAEYDADRTGALLVKDPDAMIRALKTFHEYFEKMPKAERDAFNAELKREKTLLNRLKMYTFDAHPALESRIARLQELGKNLARGFESAIGHLPPL